MKPISIESLPILWEAVNENASQPPKLAKRASGPHISKIFQQTGGLLDLPNERPSLANAHLSATGTMLSPW